MRTTSKFAALAAAGAVVIGVSPAADAADAGSVGPTGSVVGLPLIPGHVAPAENRLVAVGGAPSGTCFGSVTADIDVGHGDGAVFVDWKVHQFGVGTCGLEATLTWRNLDTGESGEHRLFQDRPGNWPSHGDDRGNTSVTGAGAVEYHLVTNGGGVAEPIVWTTP